MQCIKEFDFALLIFFSYEKNDIPFFLTLYLLFSISFLGLVRPMDQFLKSVKRSRSTLPIATAEHGLHCFDTFPGWHLKWRRAISVPCGVLGRVVTIPCPVAIIISVPSSSWTCGDHYFGALEFPGREAIIISDLKCLGRVAIIISVLV